MSTVDPSTLRIRHTPALTTVADRVTPDDPCVRAVADRMIAMAIDAKGVGLAAPQVGLGWRLIVCLIDGRWLMLANPEIERRSREKTSESEGCLSLPGVSVRVVRSREVLVRYDVPGSANKTRVIEACGTSARILQHEIDHLNGVLITRRSIGVRGPKKRRARRKSKR